MNAVLVDGVTRVIDVGELGDTHRGHAVHVRPRGGARDGVLLAPKVVFLEELVANGVSFWELDLLDLVVPVHLVRAHDFHHEIGILVIRRFVADHHVATQLIIRTAIPVDVEDAHRLWFEVAESRKVRVAVVVALGIQFTLVTTLQELRSRNLDFLVQLVPIGDVVPFFDLLEVLLAEDHVLYTDAKAVVEVVLGVIVQEVDLVKAIVVDVEDDASLVLLVHGANEPNGAWFQCRALLDQQHLTIPLVAVVDIPRLTEPVHRDGIAAPREA